MLYINYVREENLCASQLAINWVILTGFWLKSSQIYKCIYINVSATIITYFVAAVNSLTVS